MYPLLKSLVNPRTSISLISGQLKPELNLLFQEVDNLNKELKKELESQNLKDKIYTARINDLLLVNQAVKNTNNHLSEENKKLKIYFIFFSCFSLVLDLLLIYEI